MNSVDSDPANVYFKQISCWKELDVVHSDGDGECLLRYKLRPKAK